MDPLTALGLAAAILQFVEAGSKIVKRLSEFSEDVDNVPKSFRQVKTELPLIVDGLRRINEQLKSGALEPATEAALVPVITECIHAVRQLNDLLDNTLPSANASTWERRKKALASLAKDKKVDDLVDALGRYLRVLTFHQVLNPTPPQLQIEPTALERPSNFFWLVPFDRNPSFVGRDAIFQSINRAFDVRKGSQPKAALCGLGGIGKSQIALEYCYRRRLENNEFSVFWVNAATASRFEESFKRIAIECNLANRNSATSDGVLIVQEWLQSRHQMPWVMVVDNVDDESSFFHDKMSNGKTASQCIPRCPHGTLLFTTRTRDMAVDLATPAAPIAIAELSEEEGVQLVKERLEERYRGDDEVIRTFLAELEYIPLAITQAVAFISKRRKTIANYLEQYRKSEVTKSRLLSFEFADHGRQDGSLESIAKTWSLSFEWIRNTNPRAANLLCLISFFQHQAIPRILLSDPENDLDDEDDDLEDALGILRAYSFLDTDEKEEIFDTHRLVQTATKCWLEGEDPVETSLWAYRALRSVSRHFPKPTSVPVGNYWAVCESLLPHADLLLRHHFKNIPPGLQRDVDLERARLLAHTGRYLPWTGAYNEASVRLKESVSIREKELGERAIETLTSMRLLVWVLGCGGVDVDSGVKLGERVLALCTEVLGDDHPDTIDVMSDLATALNNNNQKTQSEPLHREAVLRSTRVLGRHHPDTLNCIASLASVLDDLGNFDEAVELMCEICPVKREALGEDHPDMLANEQNLAMMLMRIPELQEDALAILQRILETMTKTMGVDHRETLVVAHNRIIGLMDYGETDEALALCVTILAACEDGPRRNEQRSQEMIRKIEALKDEIESVLKGDE